MRGAVYINGARNCGREIHLGIVKTEAVAPSAQARGRKDGLECGRFNSSPVPGDGWMFRLRRNSMTRFIRWVVAASLLLYVSPVFAQSRNTGEIRGTVTAAGAVVAGATVTLTNLDTGESKVFTTNDVGIYDTVSTP